MTRAKKIIIASAAALVLLAGFTLFWFLRYHPVADSPAMEAYGVSDYGIDVYGRNLRVTKTDLQLCLNSSYNGEQLARSPRFHYLLIRPGYHITLTPRDQLILCLYEGDEQDVADNKARYEGKIVTARYLPIADGGATHRPAIHDAPPTRSQIAEVFAQTSYPLRADNPWGVD